MLVSHSHKFILIKTKKTAGSSIQSYLKKYCKNGIVEEVFGSHRGAASIAQKIGSENWNAYLKICPIRNPWDQMVSWYLWERRELSLYRRVQRLFQGKEVHNPAQKLSFKEYLLSRKMLDNVNINSDKILIEGELPEYFFIKYETLFQDMQKLCTQLAIPFDKELFPHKKGGVRTEKNYQKFYDEETKQIISDCYRIEIEKFGYAF